jgi:hypothetical protein
MKLSLPLLASFMHDSNFISLKLLGHTCAIFRDGTGFPSLKWNFGKESLSETLNTDEKLFLRGLNFKRLFFIDVR